MGKVTHQYSPREIVEKYRKHIDGYKNIIKDLENILQSSYIKKQNIGIFLKYHLAFCREAIEVLQDAVEAIQSDAVDESICIRLESLFACCAKEHKNLEDTYSRINEEPTKEFNTYYNIHIRLRDACDEMEYCDETVRFVRARIRKKSNTNIFYGEVNNLQIQQDVHNSVQKAGTRETKIKDTIIEKEKTSLKAIFREKAYESIIGIVLFMFATILYKIQLKGMMSALELEIKCLAIIVMIGSALFGIVLLVVCVLDVINVLSLSRVGTFVELESKWKWLGEIGGIFSNSESSEPKDVRSTGKCYKNIDGQIYRIKGKKCPYCETQPIGKMILNYSNCENRYFWKCTQNQAHVMEFDYKKKM